MVLLSSPCLRDNENPSPTSSHLCNGSSTGSSSHLTITPAAAATFVQADATSFKQVVQMLTGSSETTKKASSITKAGGCSSIPPIKKKPRFKLYERRNSLKTLMITPAGGFSQSSEMLSPSVIDFRALVLSPNEEEEKAIAEKKFYLHPSPRSAQTHLPEPRLLPLFPVTSPSGYTA